MPEPISPDKVAKILDLRKDGMTFPDIAKELGMVLSTVQRHYYLKRGKKKEDNMHYLTPAETNKVINLTQEGLSAKAIAEKTGLTVYNIYKARNEGNVKGVFTGPRTKDTLKRDKKIFKMKMKGMTTKEVAEKLHQPISTIDSSYYRHRNLLQQKGAMNGIDNSSGSDEQSATTSELIGVAYGETIRLITNLSERIKVPADKLRRRLSELLASPTLR